MDHVGCRTCGYAARVVQGIRVERCPDCASGLAMISTGEARDMLRERGQILRLERAGRRPQALATS
jgi:hypothetical protein